MSETSDVPYDELELIQRAISNACADHAYEVAEDETHPCPRWAIVKRLFGCGSSVAAAICRKYGHDPEETIGGGE